MTPPQDNEYAAFAFFGVELASGVVSKLPLGNQIPIALR